MIWVIKKDGTLEAYNENKIVNACKKASMRALDDLDDSDYKRICDNVMFYITSEYGTNDGIQIPVSEMHSFVEKTLMELYPNSGETYRQYRNYKIDFVHMLDDVYQKSQSIRYIGDVSNANTDSTMVSTQRSLIYGQLNKNLYRKFFLNRDELQASNDGYIYIHDMKDRLDGMNCCLFDMGNVISGGFEMGNVWYNEPKSLDVAFDVISDVAMSAASQQYGGFTIPRVDTILAPYAEKSYKKYIVEYKNIVYGFDDATDINQQAHEYAMSKVYRDMEQGFQSWEYRFNTVGSSRGDYPFVAISFGIGQNDFERMATEVALKVRMGGQGKEGFKRPVLFPKLTFLYDENLHGEGKSMEYLFDIALECSSKTMYPDFLSLTGEGYIPSIYKKYGQVISLMGCRASLSPWYVRGGMEPADDEDYPVFEGRFNLGAISLHLPMILAKARQENKDFYEVLDYYLEMIRNLHKRTYDFFGEKFASTNPLAFTQGGFLGGKLNPNDKIRPILKPCTMSFGITALNELQELYNGKSLVEDGEFALEVMQYINDYVNRIKKEDGILYAIYGTPAESLCFSGDTEVQTYNGNKKIKDVKEGDLVYSFNEKEHKIELKKVITSKKTIENAKVVRVTFDNGQELTCTPNHPFAVRKPTRDEEGKFSDAEHIEYVAAMNLKNGDRIKSNYMHVNMHGRPSCSMYHNGSKQLVQDINAEYSMGIKPEGYVVHHKNENKTDNSFDNLVYMSDTEHRIYHMKDTIADYCYTVDGQSGELNSFYGKTHTDEAKFANRLKHLGKSVERFDLDGNHIEHFECIGDAEKIGLTRHLIKLACDGERNIDTDSHYYKDSLWYYTEDCENMLEQNHKVVSVEFIDDRYDVYDIEVEDNHNFFVGGDNGVLVHNCGLQIEQFRKKYGIVKGVSDRAYVSNSFHCGVWEEITPIQKQDLEGRFWNYFNGGKIQYCRYPVFYNKEAQKTLVRRAMDKGFYEGCNLSLSYCENCGYEQLDMDVCPKCGSEDITQIDRMNGYIGYTKIHGKSRYNQAKVIEISERKSM
nr:MAG TPA: anaerobic ribonucleoside triphosphate reductase [Caudoviricetes sp.]